MYPYLSYVCILWGNNYNAPLSQIVKFQSKKRFVLSMMLLYNGINKSTLRVLIGFFKFPDIVKLKTCLLFYDYSSIMKRFLIYLFH